MTHQNLPTADHAEETSNSVIKLQDLLYLCLKNWYWIVISIIVCMGIACLYLVKATPIYTRTASILIKEDKGKSGASATLDAFSDLGIAQATSNIENEISTLKSPDVIEDVVRRLHLDVSYAGDGAFHRSVLYGSSLPVNVSFPDAPADEAIAFTLKINPDNTFSISDLVVNGEELNFDSSKKYPLNSTIKTVAGNIRVEKTPFFSPSDDSMNVYVQKSRLKNAVLHYSNELAIAKDNEKGTVINLTIQDASIQRASDVLNGVIDVYNENWVKDKNQIAVSTSNFINERLGVIEQELGHVDTDISSYKSTHLIPDIQATAGMALSKGEQTDSEILELNNQLQMTQYLRDFISRESSRYQILPVNTGIGNGSIEGQITEYNELLMARNKLLSNSSESNPVIVDADTRLASIRHNILSSLENQTVSLNTAIRNLQRSASKTTAQLAANPTQARYLLSVERQQKVKESLYLYLLQKREENELSQAFSAYNTRVIKNPTGADAPSSPVRRNILLVAFLVGLALPVGIMFLMEVGNTRLRGRADVDDLGVPVIGEIPEIKSKDKKKERYRFIGNKHRRESNIDTGLKVKSGKRDAVNEAFRVIRTNITFLSSGTPSSVMMVTSFNPGSGKTFIAANLATALAIKDKKVIVVDCDMRRATLSQYVESPKKGLANYLAGSDSDLNSLVLKDTLVKNLSVLPVGKIPPNPTELLESKRFTDLIERLRSEYDYVLLDCPPVVMMADAQIINQVIDRAIFVLRVGLFRRDMLIDVERLYNEKKFHHMGIILNGVVVDKSRYGYGYGYNSYGYGYGYGYSNVVDDDDDTPAGKPSNA